MSSCGEEVGDQITRGSRCRRGPRTWRDHRLGLTSRAEHVQKALTSLRSKSGNQHAPIMIDCSHGNSSKNHLNQPKVAADIAGQVAAGESGIVGIM